MIDYSGDDIVFEEMPQGCFIYGKDGQVLIASLKDATALRDSLNKSIEFLEKRDIHENTL